MQLKRIQTFTYCCVSVSKEVNLTHANNLTYYVAALITDALFFLLAHIPLAGYLDGQQS